MMRGPAGALCAVPLLLAATALASDIRTERVEFARGATSTHLEGHVTGHHGVDYLVRAREGQVMNASLASQNASVTFNIIAPGETDVAFHIGSTAGNQFEGRLPRDGDYRIRVHLERAAAQQGRSASYRLEVAIGGGTAGAAAAPAHPRQSAAERAGEGRYDATGQIPCAQTLGQPMGQCAFGVARDGGGTATVVVTRPDGRKRAIFFERGRVLTADISQADGDIRLGVHREADLNMIRIGTERYEIPDAVPSGG